MPRMVWSGERISWLNRAIMSVWSTAPARRSRSCSGGSNRGAPMASVSVVLLEFLGVVTLLPSRRMIVVGSIGRFPSLCEEGDRRPTQASSWALSCWTESMNSSTMSKTT